MERDAVVGLPDEEDEVVHGFWRVFGKQLQLDGAPCFDADL